MPTRLSVLAAISAVLILTLAGCDHTPPAQTPPVVTPPRNVPPAGGPPYEVPTPSDS